jgi:transposase
MEKFKAWLDAVWPTVLPQSSLGKAIQYCFNLWPGLIRFLEDGRLEIDNNLTEQQIKPFVIARKNFLFAASVDGAKALCMHFSLIRTAKAQGLDPYHYYVEILKKIPHCKTVEDYEKLLPWNMKKQSAVG